jgi:integrase/recombinase XerC
MNTSRGRQSKAARTPGAQLPAVQHTRFDSEPGAGSALHPLWLRLEAFLRMRAPSTAITYRGIVREWSRFLGAEAPSAKAAELLIKATDLHASAYRAWLEQAPGEVPRLLRKRQQTARDVQPRTDGPKARAKKSGLESTQGNATIAKKFAALRRIYRMLQGCNLHAGQNPFDRDVVPAPPKNSGRKRPTEMLDFALVRSVIAQADAATPKGLRDQAMLSCLFGAGLRRSEVVNLRLADFRRTTRGSWYLYLRSTKAKRDAQQALPQWAAKSMQLLAEQRRQAGASDADYFFVSYVGQAGKSPTTRPISASGLYLLFKRYCRLAGAGEFLSPHSARATAITKLLSDGITHRKVQEFSRHASIQMVEAYDKRRVEVDESPGNDLEYE